jgi:CMP-N,N'-diacetyllegionaminic acid synthase
MRILITLCARGGSKGIPGKNIRSLGGKPLIGYSIKHAKEFSKIQKSDIALSTDNNEIKSIAEDFGLYTKYLRPQNLATDNAGKIDTILHLLEYEEKTRNITYDYVIDLDISSPFRCLDDINKAFLQIVSEKDALNIFSVNKANRNPYFNMVEQQSNGYFSLVKNGNFLTRQSAPKVYDMNASFYIFRRSFFDKKYNSTISEKSLIYEMPHICFDLDHNLDFEFMEFLIDTNKLDFTI